MVPLAVQVRHSVVVLLGSILLALLQEKAGVGVLAVAWTPIVLYLIALVVEAIILNWRVKEAIIVRVGCFVVGADGV